VLITPPINIEITFSDENLGDCHDLFESCLALVWALAYDEEPARKVREAGSLKMLSNVIKCKDPRISMRGKNIAIKALWMILSITDSLDEADDYDIIPYILNTSLSRNATPAIRLTCAQFLVSHLLDAICIVLTLTLCFPLTQMYLSPHETHLLRLQTISKVKVPLECIFITFLETEDVDLASYGAVGLARMAISSSGDISRKAAAEMGAIPALLKWASLKQSKDLLESIMMAICNLSVRSENQVRERYTSYSDTAAI
jgi:hypothetical protein